MEKPHLGIIYQEVLPKEIFNNFITTVSTKNLNFKILSEPITPYAMAIEWCVGKRTLPPERKPMTQKTHTKKAYAKINTFLKITGHKNGYHTLLSRFVKVPHLYDIVSFVPQACESFTIEGCGDVAVESNTIYKAFKAMNVETDFFKHHKVVVEKHIPTGAGLGGGSSDAGAFMRLFNEVCELGIDTPTLAQMGSTVGADIPFFVYDYESANVSGFGEVVEPFEDDEMEIELYMPSIHCDTPLVYKTFKKELFDGIEPTSFEGWDRLTTKEVLGKVDAIEANDLYKASLIAYPELKEIAPKDWYFSGSGSTFFRISL